MHLSRLICLCLCLIILLGVQPCFVSAQQPNNLPLTEPKKVDEFGDILLTDIAARLDYFAVELQKHPDARAFLFTYRSRRDLPGLSSRLLWWLKHYLIDARGVAADRVVAIDGGVASHIVQELWLVPPGSAPPVRRDAYQNIYEDTSSARLFDVGPVYVARDAPESFGGHINHSLEGFSEALRKEPAAFAYLIGYAEHRVEDWDEKKVRGKTVVIKKVFHDQPRVIAAALAKAKRVLINEYKIPASRIKTVNGGYRKWRNIELWIVPRGEHAPIPTPNAFPGKRK